MSESQTSSASASTILSVSSDLPLDDAVSVQTTETTNSLQKTKINYENFCLKNDAITNIASDLIRQDEKVKFPAEVQEQQSNGYLEVEKLVQNMNEDDVQHIAIAYPMNSAKGDENENEEKQKVIMVGGESDKRKAEVVESEMRDDDDDDDDNKMWMTPVNSSVIGNVKIKVENDEAVCEESLKIVEEEKKATNLTNIRDERQHSFYDSSREATNSEMIKNAENVDLMKSASLESYANRAISKSPEHRCIRTTSESPPSATDSWKNATINTNNFIDIGTRSGDTQAANNTTTLQNHQTKIIYNNKTLNLGEVIHHHPLFVKNTSKYWYKPTISREEAVNMLRDKPPGTFVVRDSNSFPGAFGLALKVSTPPPGVHPGDGTELVRHFLIEPSSKGVKLKGCNNEPVFGTLSALVYQHSIIPLALPTKLLLPEYDPANTPEHISAAQQLLQQGAACNVTYIVSLDTESLTGPEAARRCIDQTFELLKQKMIQPVSVHFKVSSQGVTITDNTRRLFFRRHYPVQSVTYAGLDPSDRRWDNSYLEGSMTKYVKNARMFAFVARKIGSRTDNTCHIFAELEPEQPAIAVVNFITKVMMGRR